MKGDGEFTVSVHPELRQLNVTLETRTYPVVRVVQVRGRTGLLFPRRPSNPYTGLIWEERPGLVVQVLGSQGVRDRMLLDVAEGRRHHCRSPPAGLDSGRAGRQVVGLGRQHDGAARSYRRGFSKGPGQRPYLVVTETRGQVGPLRPEDRPKRLPDLRRTWVTVHGHPALLDHDPINHELAVTWREPGGIELVVRADERVGRRQLLAVAEGLRQP